MKRFLCTLTFCALFISTSKANALTKSVDLWNGKDLSNWKLVTTPAADIATVCQVKNGMIAVAGKPNGYLLAPGTYDNYKLHAEWRWTDKSGNSGFLVHISDGPVDRVWPTCFQIQTKNTRVGDLLPMAAAKFAEPLSTPPNAKTPQPDRKAADSEKPVGEWNVCEIICKDGSIECTVNGIVQNKVTGCVPRSGQIGIQLEGTPYELRNIRISPLN